MRGSNEDNFLLDEALGLAMVADGMGGHAAGEVASAGVLTALRDYLHEHARGAGRHRADGGLRRPGRHLVRSGDRARSACCTTRSTTPTPACTRRTCARDCADGGGMGTTLTGFWRASGDAPLVFFHVGDSRLYRQRGGLLEQLTRDQTMYQQALEAGMIEHLPARNLLLQAVGPSAAGRRRRCARMLVQAGDVLMLCSDGLHGSVPHGEIEAALARRRRGDAEQACARLIAMAKDYGGRDNITVLLALLPALTSQPCACQSPSSSAAKAAGAGRPRQTSRQGATCGEPSVHHRLCPSAARRLRNRVQVRRAARRRTR